MSHKQVKNQQQQIDGFSSTMLAWARSQEVVNEGTCVIEHGVEYNVLFIDYNNKLAVLTSKNNDGKTRYTINLGTPKNLLDEWSSKRHFRGGE